MNNPPIIKDNANMTVDKIQSEIEEEKLKKLKHKILINDLNLRNKEMSIEKKRK